MMFEMIYRNKMSKVIPSSDIIRRNHYMIIHDGKEYENIPVGYFDFGGNISHTSPPLHINLDDESNRVRLRFEEDNKKCLIVFNNQAEYSMKRTMYSTYIVSGRTIIINAINDNEHFDLVNNYLSKLSKEETDKKEEA